jgi:hypothetical protein
MIKARPKTTSNTFIIIAMTSAYGSKKEKKEEMSPAKTEKYSSILIAVPIGSLTLISPLKMNNPPTKYLTIVMRYFIINYISSLIIQNTA